MHLVCTLLNKPLICAMITDPLHYINISTSDFQSEVGEVFGEIGGELPAKFGRRFSSFFCWGKSSEAFSTKTPPQISPSNFTTRFWVVAGPINSFESNLSELHKGMTLKGHTLFSECQPAPRHFGFQVSDYTALVVLKFNQQCAN